MLKVAEKIEFNPKSKKHRDQYKEFLTNGKWPTGITPFKAEWPHLSVDATIQSKLVRHTLNIPEQAAA